MGLKKGRRVRIEVPTDSVPEFELGDTTDIQRRREEGEREEQAQRQREEEARSKEEARTEETYSPKEGVAEKQQQTKNSDTETEAGGEAATSSHSCYKMGHMTKMLLTHSYRLHERPC